MLQGLNHITLVCCDLDRSLGFYTGLLGMRAHVRWAKGAYLSAGPLWFCLTLGEPKPSQDYSHVAFSVAPEDWPKMRARLAAAEVATWQENQSEGDSIYLLDPDGHQLELHVGDLYSRLASLKQQPYAELEWLDTLE